MRSPLAFLAPFLDLVLAGANPLASQGAARQAPASGQGQRHASGPDLTLVVAEEIGDHSGFRDVPLAK